jgi:hypothetical protein
MLRWGIDILASSTPPDIHEIAARGAPLKGGMLRGTEPKDSQADEELGMLTCHVIVSLELCSTNSRLICADKDAAEPVRAILGNLNCAFAVADGVAMEVEVVKVDEVAERGGTEV